MHDAFYTLLSLAFPCDRVATSLCLHPLPPHRPLRFASVHATTLSDRELPAPPSPHCQISALHECCPLALIFVMSSATTSVLTLHCARASLCEQNTFTTASSCPSSSASFSCGISSSVFSLRTAKATCKNDRFSSCPILPCTWVTFPCHFPVLLARAPSGVGDACGHSYATRGPSPPLFVLTTERKSLALLLLLTCCGVARNHHTGMPTRPCANEMRW